MTLRHVVAKSSGGGPGDKRACVGAFPGTISAWKGFFGEVPACASPRKGSSSLVIGSHIL